VKWLLKIIDTVRPTFEEGGKLRLLNPVFGALEHFFFAPSTRTIGAPHVRDPLDLKRVMSMVIIAVVPSVLAAFYFFGLRFLAMIIVSYAAGLTVEAIFAMVRKEGINEGFFVTGILWPLILPPNLPLWMVALGVAFGVLIGKELFGGTGRNVFNPALVGRCFLSLAYPKVMAASWVEPSHELVGGLLTWVTPSLDAVSGATPLALAKQGEMGSTAHMLLGHIDYTRRRLFAVYPCRQLANSREHARLIRHSDRRLNLGRRSYIPNLWRVRPDNVAFVCRRFAFWRVLYGNRPGDRPNDKCGQMVLRYHNRLDYGSDPELHRIRRGGYIRHSAGKHCGPDSR